MGLIFLNSIFVFLDTAICSVSGDPHYTSFDKKVHHFMGACSYTLTKPCNETSGLPYFSVETQNEHRDNNKKVSYVRSVIIHVYDMKLILGKGRKVQVKDISDICESQVTQHYTHSLICISCR